MAQNKILIVDDESFNLDILEFSLNTLENLEILRADNAKMAFDFIAEHEIDLIILDILMPNMSGLEMLKIIKFNESTRNIPTIMVSAKNEERHTVLEYGSEDFLVKPVDVIELKLKVNNLLKIKQYNDLQHKFNEKLKEEIAEKEIQLRKWAQVEQELSMAKMIQESILPKRYPDSNNLDIYGKCTQASEVGGDYFDVFETECGGYTICIMADVSGHGIASSLITIQLRTLVRSELRWATNSLSERVGVINNIMAEDMSESSMFVTGLFMRIEHDTKIIESVNAGHYNPFGNITMEHKSGVPIGIIKDAFYDVLETQFKEGDSILLYTDGVVEGENRLGDMYEDTFYSYAKTLHHLRSQEQIEQILLDYYEFIDKQIDDVTMLSIKF